MHTNDARSTSLTLRMRALSLQVAAPSQVPQPPLPSLFAHEATEAFQEIVVAPPPTSEAPQEPAPSIDAANLIRSRLLQNTSVTRRL